MVYLITNVQKITVTYTGIEGRPQIVVDQQTRVQINVAHYIASRVDHNSWYTCKEKYVEQ